MKYLRMKAEEIGNTTTADVIRLCVNDMPQGGKLDEIRARLRVLDAVDRSNGVLALEDSDAKTLQRCVGEMKWAKVRPDIVAFGEAVADMPSTPPEAHHGE